jgi:hypothetical protein
LGDPDHLEVVELAHDLLGHFEFVYAAKAIRLAVFGAREELLKNDHEIEVGSNLIALA